MRLARAGRPEQIHAGSLAQQLTEAEHRGDGRRDRAPGASGAGGASRSTQPRAGRARGVVGAGGRGRLGRGRNQALAAERADVSRLEQALHHVRDEIAKAVKALADYAREYWERNRQEKLARERDDLWRTR